MIVGVLGLAMDRISLTRRALAGEIDPILLHSPRVEALSGITNDIHLRASEPAPMQTPARTRKRRAA